MNFETPPFPPPPPGLTDPVQAANLQSTADRALADRVETLENVLRPYLPRQILEAGNEGPPQTVEVLAQLLGVPSAPANPYTLGTTADGSTDPDASAEPPDPEEPMTDTADVAAPPKDIDGEPTDGFEIKYLTRIHDVNDVASGTTQRKTFFRRMVFRSGGLFATATDEEIEEEIIVSGSGSAGGTV